jgi:hypothetical protein
MEYRRAEDQAITARAKNGLLRIRTEIIVIIILMVAIYFIPPEAKQGLLALGITKALFVTLGVLYAHASRKFLFPFMDLADKLAAGQWGMVVFLTAWYSVIIWAFSMGG